LKQFEWVILPFIPIGVVRQIYEGSIAFGPNYLKRNPQDIQH